MWSHTLATDPAPLPSFQAASITEAPLLSTRLNSPTYHYHRPHLRCALSPPFPLFLLPALLMPFFPDFASTQLGATNTQIGLTFSLLPLTILLASPLVAYLSNRLGRPLVFNAGLLILGEEEEEEEET